MYDLYEATFKFSNLRLFIIALKKNFKNLKSSSGHGICIRMVIMMVRNLLSSTAPFEGHKDTRILDVFRGISERRPVNESCSL